MRWNIAGVGEVAGTFGWGEGSEELADSVPEGFDGARGGGSEERLELGESVLDRVQVRTVGRQIEELGARGLDRFAHAFDLVRAEIVEHDDVARTQLGRQGLLDIGQEARAVDRAVEDAGRRKAVVAQRGDDRRGFPMAVGYRAHDPRPAACPSVTARQGRGRPGLVEEHEPLRAQIRLARAPGAPRRGDVRAVLLSGMLRLFFRVRPAVMR